MAPVGRSGLSLCPCLVIYAVSGVWRWKSCAWIKHTECDFADARFKIYKTAFWGANSGVLILVEHWSAIEERYFSQCFYVTFCLKAQREKMPKRRYFLIHRHEIPHLENAVNKLFLVGSQIGIYLWERRRHPLCLQSQPIQSREKRSNLCQTPVTCHLKLRERKSGDLKEACFWLFLCACEALRKPS